MEFAAGLLHASAPEFFVSGVAAAEIIDSSVVKITFYSETHGDKVPVATFVWTLKGWQKARDHLRLIAAMIADAEVSATPVNAAAGKTLHH